MISRFIFTSLVISLVVGCTTSFNCGNVLTIEQRGLLNYLATVNFTTPVPLEEDQWTLEMETDYQYTFLGSLDAWVLSNPEEGRATFKSRNENMTISSGEILTFRFRIKWFTDEPIPKVVSLIWQNQQLCSPGGPSIDEIKANRSRRRRVSNNGISETRIIYGRRYGRRRPVN